MRGWTPHESALSSVDSEALAIMQNKPALATRPITPDPDRGVLPDDRPELPHEARFPPAITGIARSRRLVPVSDL